MFNIWWNFNAGTSWPRLDNNIIGLMLSSYPGKYKIEKRLFHYQEYLKQSMTEKSDEPPLNLWYYFEDISSMYLDRIFNR